MSWSEKVITSWDALNQVIQTDLTLERSPGETNYLYRGQANKKWDLVPSLLRVFRRHGIEDADMALAIEELLRGTFLSQAHEHLHPNVGMKIKSRLLDWWTLMQHYSAPTRLLDWTRSPYMGVYFAVMEEHEHDGAIWYFHQATLMTTMKAAHEDYQTGSLSRKKPIRKFEKRIARSDAADELYVIQRPIETDRMTVQQAMYTLCARILGDHGEIIAGSLPTPSPPSLAGKWIVPRKNKMSMLAKLRVANITGGSLFPGLDGVGRGMNDLANLEADYEATR